MYAVVFTPKAENQFKKLEREVQDRIVKILERIKIRPEQFVDKLIGEEGYKLRVGDYRVFLDIKHDKLIILVIDLGHRKNVYKN